MTKMVIVLFFNENALCTYYAIATEHSCWRLKSVRVLYSCCTCETVAVRVPLLYYAELLELYLVMG